MRIERYKDEYYVALVDFLKKHWAISHILYNKEIFDWQYYHEKHMPQSLIAFHEDKIVGFLGNIPGKYSVNGKNVDGVGLTMWVVDSNLRNSGLGIFLMRETEKLGLVSLTLGCNVEVVPLYKGMNYSYIDKLNRYVVPLQIEEYSQLCSGSLNRDDLEKWYREIWDSPVDGLQPNPNVDNVILEELYKKSIGQAFKLSRYRDEYYWDWRYKKNLGYQYLFFGNPIEDGIVVARLEKVVADNNPQLQGIKVLRIIEIIPQNKNVWFGESDNIIQLVQGVINWGRMQGCVAADYQCSNKRLGHILNKVGFNEQEKEYQPPLYSLAGLFQPLRYLVSPINFAWKVKDEFGGLQKIDADDTYFVKSDCDMDRPNK